MEIRSNFTPYPKQEEIIERIIGTDIKNHVLVSSRQCGKTLLASNLLLYYAINSPGSYNVLVSPVFSQSKKTFTDLVNACGDNNPIIKGSNSSELILTFVNGSVIRMASAESRQNLRGFTVSGILIIDEAAFLDQQIWTEILMPTTIIRGQKVLFISTPNGFNWFKDLYDLGTSKSSVEWESHRIRSEDNPYLAKSILEMAKLILPPKAYLQEYEGEFVEGGGSVFEFGECATINDYGKGPEPGRKYFAGLDLAIAGDYTVLTILDDLGNVVDFFRENGTSWEQIIEKVSKKINHWKCLTFVEKNSIGSVIYEQLRKLCGPNLIEGFNTTQESKSDIIENLKLSFAKRSIRIPTKNLNPDMHIELSGFGYKLLSSGKILYKGQGGLHDDIVISLSLANHCLVTKRVKGTYAVYSGR